VVIRRDADVLNVAGAQAHLTGCRSRELEPADTEELGFELVHSCGSEQDRRIVAWNEHVAGLADAAFGFKETQIAFTKLVGFHERSLCVFAAKRDHFERNHFERSHFETVTRR
jgi:hypothetical protein